MNYVNEISVSPTTQLSEYYSRHSNTYLKVEYIYQINVAIYNSENF